MSGPVVEILVKVAAIWTWTLGVVVTARLLEPQPEGRVFRLITILLWPLALAIYLAAQALDALATWLVEKVLP